MASCVITIAREHGSGGRGVGKLLAERLGVKYYDNELITMAARESGFSEDFVRKMESAKTGSVLYDIFVSSSMLPVGDQVFLAQSRAIREAAKEPCVIVGRCANYVLRQQDNCLNVFIHAPIGDRVARVRDVYREGGDDPAGFIHKMDKRRAAYYNYNTGWTWGRAQDFDLCVSTRPGIERAADIIMEAVKSYE